MKRKLVTYEWDILDENGVALQGYKVFMTFNDEQCEELKGIYNAMLNSENIIVYDIGLAIPDVRVDIVHPDGAVEHLTERLEAEVGYVDGKIITHTEVQLANVTGIVDMLLEHPHNVTYYED